MPVERKVSETRKTRIDRIKPIYKKGNSILKTLMPAARIAVISSDLFIVLITYMVEINAATGVVCRMIKGIIER
tara:strand:+ start:285 stop:506 length:222 start_codon:yes stop_codon:yes gene_type:complete